MRIALFDSGYGGLTVLSHARRVLPSEEFIFYADRDHVPYGTKSVPAVRGFVRTAFRFLIEQQRADAVVVACNTATSVAVDEMRRLYDVPIIGMEPAVKKALTHDAEHRVLVTATPITDGWRALFSIFTPSTECLPMSPCGPSPMALMPSSSSCSILAARGFGLCDPMGRMSAFFEWSAATSTDVPTPTPTSSGGQAFNP